MRGGGLKKKTSLHHTESPDSHVVYCRLTKGWEVRTVTPGNMNEVPQRCLRASGRGREAESGAEGKRDNKGKGILAGRKTKRMQTRQEGRGTPR